jgi:AraC family transcriptional regulator
MILMTRQTRLPPQLPSEPVRRAEAGPWVIELLPGAPYEARYIASQAAIGFAFDSQRGVHAIGSDRIRPFYATPNGLAFVPMGCDVFSASSQGGEYLRLIRSDGAALIGDQPFNNRVDPQAMLLAQRMRAALLRPSATDDWQDWAQALAARANADRLSAASPLGTLTGKRLRLLDEFIDAGLGEPLSVQNMAQLLDLSEGFFTRACKQTLGKSPHSYLIDRRLGRARDLLRESARSLSDIALACGFANQAHMATVFKQRLGVSPSGLRRT